MERMNLSAALLCVLLAGAARAQAPEDEWGTYQPASPPAPTQPAPGALPPPPPLPPPSGPFYAPPPPQPFAGPARPRPEVLNRVRLVEEPNRVGVAASPTLGPGKRGQMVSVGFPLIQVRALFGLGERFDLGVGFDSYYFLMNEPLAVARVGILRSERWSLTATLEAGYAFFVQRASREANGSRWITGRRNINVRPSLGVAYQGTSVRAARVFFSLGYLLALDTEPYATDPLVGVPPAIVAGHNVAVKGGAELPLSSRTAFVFWFGFDVHGRADDSVLMPSASVGLVTSL
jgi:hypothetical protein